MDLLLKSASAAIGLAPIFQTRRGIASFVTMSFLKKKISKMQNRSHYLNNWAAEYSSKTPPSNHHRCVQIGQVVKGVSRDAKLKVINLDFAKFIKMGLNNGHIKS